MSQGLWRLDEIAAFGREKPVIKTRRSTFAVVVAQPSGTLWRLLLALCLNTRLGARCRSYLLELFQRARPVFVQEPRQRAICEQLAAGLAARAVVGLVL